MTVFQQIKNYTSDEDFNKNLKHLGLQYFDNNETGLTLIKYNQGDKSIYDFNNPLIRYSRGLVFDRETHKILCIPPEKSIHIVPFSQNIPLDKWLEVNIEEFVDGTMINCFNHGGSWHISTRSFIGANCKWYSNKKFNDMFEEAKGNMDFTKLNPDVCYTFVLKHPENRIVTNYSDASICLVQAREIGENSFDELNLEKTQKNLEEQGISVSIPFRYNISKPDDINEIIKNMDYEKQGLVFKFNGFRSKVRNTEYDKAKHLRGNNKNSLFNYIELRQKSMIKDYLEYFPEYKDEFNEYRRKVESKTMNLFNWYKQAYIYKAKDKKEIPFELRPLCYEMHGIFLDTRKKWERGDVINYFNRLEPAKMIFIINFEKNKDYHMGKVTNVESEPVESEPTEMEVV
jgi:hypothetical protein